MKDYIIKILRGVGQVMLQNSVWTGLLFLIGIFYNSWLLGLGAILGTIISTNTALILKYSKDDIDNGLYGFNGTLVGIAILFYFPVNFLTIFFLVFGAFISTIIMNKMKLMVPAYTAPFVLSTWVVIIAIKFFSLSSLIFSPLPPDTAFYLFSMTSHGLGQVMFQGSLVTGLIFLLAIFINSKMSALYALYGSALGGFLALALSLPLNAINIGLFGYNAVLCGIALGSKTKKNFILATLAILLSVVINYLMGNLGFITLTAPFVLATWIVLLIKKTK